jgi:hypothetical protein
MAGLVAFGDVMIFVGGLVVGVMFKDKLVWIKDKLVAVYDWIKAKF